LETDVGVGVVTHPENGHVGSILNSGSIVPTLSNRSPTQPGQIVARERATASSG
jgi:hypothetical protein